MEYKNVLINKIKEAMNSQGVKKAELANRMGVNRGVVTKMLSGDFNPTLCTLIKLQNSLNIKILL